MSIEQFLRLCSAAPACFCGDDKIIVVSNLSGMRQLYSIGRTGSSEMKRIAELPEPVSAVYEIPKANSVIVSLDRGGNERLQIYRVDLDDSKLTTIVEDFNFVHRVGGVSKDGKRLSYVSNRRNNVDFDVYIRSLDRNDDDVCVWQGGGLASVTGFSHDGRSVCVVVPSVDKNLDHNIYLVEVDTKKCTHVNPHEGESQCGGISFVPNGDFWFSCNEGREFLSPCLFEAKTGSWSFKQSATTHDTMLDVDPSGRFVLLRANVDGYDRLQLRDATTFAFVRDVPLPASGIAVLADAMSAFGPRFAADGAAIVLPFVSANEPGDVWIFDINDETTAMRRLTKLPRDVSDMVSPTLHRFASFDGLMIPAFVYRNPNIHNPPVVVLIHGGPESQYVPGFNPVVQYLVRQRFAVVCPNIRGSTGYGKTYVHLDDVEKRLDSIRDLECLHHALTSMGLDNARACAMGQSYGGYCVLMCLSHQPTLWRCGVNLYGIANMESFLENTAPFRRRHREAEYGSLVQHRALLRAISPLTHVERIVRPVFCMHGANDVRVPLAESLQLRDALTARGVRCELVTCADEGHGLTRLSNRIAVYTRIIAFLNELFEM